MDEVSRGGWLRCTVAGMVGFAAFFGLGEVVSLLGIESPIGRQVALKGLMVVVAVVAWAVLRQPPSTMGWTRLGWRAFGWNGGCWKWTVLACLAMAGATVVMILTGQRHPIASQLNFGQIVVVIWLLSSFAEEVYVRGAIQSYGQLGVDPSRLGAASPPVVVSALVFAAMHVPLIWKGGGAVGGGVIVAATLFVGWACAVVRVRSGGIWAPFLVHMLANISAVPGGIVGVIIYRLVNGSFPPMQ